LKVVTFEHNGRQGFGALKGNGIVDLTDAFGSAKAFLEGGEANLSKANDLIERGDASISVDDVRIRPPVPDTHKLLCLAGNYQSHVEEGGGTFIGKEKTWPRVFMKPPSTTIIGQNDTIILPRNAQKIDWECELAVVIGKHARFVEPDEGLDYVAGYTVIIDVSERSLEVPDAREPQDGDEWFDWLNGKWFDTFAPCGPYLTLTDEIHDPQGLPIKLSVNGVVRQDGNTGQMTYSVAELVSWSSNLVTLEPGDIIATGTLAGVGATTGEFLKDGDRVEGEIEGIGVLVCDVKAE
tara:strand:+ start:1747 stop:2628 length:882 start_codon:yes stop_codon:yes gene_type:complete